MSNTPIIIGLTGYAGAGKDTVADALVTHAGFSKIAFADALRLEVAAAFRLGAGAHILTDRATKEAPHPALAMQHCDEPDFIERVQLLEDCALDRAFIERAHSPRQILQWWGTEYRRSQSPNYWSTKTALRIAAGIQSGVDRWVVTDCRFANEARAVRTQGGEIWQVQRPGHQSPEGAHVSSTDGMQFGPEQVLINGMDVPALIRTTLRALEARHGGALVSAGIREGA